MLLIRDVKLADFHFDCPSLVVRQSKTKKNIILCQVKNHNMQVLIITLFGGDFLLLFQNVDTKLDIFSIS